MKKKILDELEFNVDFSALAVHLQDAMHMHELKPEENIKELLLELMDQVIDDAIESNIS